MTNGRVCPARPDGGARGRCHRRLRVVVRRGCWTRGRASRRSIVGSTAPGRIGGVEEVQLDVAGRGGVRSTRPPSPQSDRDRGHGGGVHHRLSCNATRPTTSNLNYLDGTTVPNVFIATIGAGGKVCLFSSATASWSSIVNRLLTTGSAFVPFGPAANTLARRRACLGAARSPPCRSPRGSSFVPQCHSHRPDHRRLPPRLSVRQHATLASNEFPGRRQPWPTRSSAKQGPGDCCVYLAPTRTSSSTRSGTSPKPPASAPCCRLACSRTRSGMATVDGCSTMSVP